MEVLWWDDGMECTIFLCCYPNRSHYHYVSCPSLCPFVSLSCTKRRRKTEIDDNILQGRMMMMMNR